MASDERREVAERLRDLPRTADADGCCTAWDVLFALGMKRCDAIGFVDVIDAQRLADLIDPTCELVELWDGERAEFRLDCTACHFGELAGELRDEDPDMYNSRNLWRDVDWQLLRHCPYCGARVVSGDE